VATTTITLTLRAATPGDDPFLYQVYATTRSAELAMVPWSDDQKSAFIEMQFRAQAQYYREHYPDTSFDLVLCDGQKAGRLYVSRLSEEIRVVDIALLPQFCNRGIGTSLLRQLQAEAVAASKPLRIHVERFNPALRLYQRLGFEQIEDKGVYLFLEWRAAGPQLA
jgi:ribosomal protein S18 acetylase RimI-like enzyme